MLARVDAFLVIAERHRIRAMLVLFGSCWHPEPALGRQPQPAPGVHNSGWIQSPGEKALANPSRYPRLREYVTGVVSAFRDDPRVLAWDVWNEPDNGPRRRRICLGSQRGRGARTADLWFHDVLLPDGRPHRP